MSADEPGPSPVTDAVEALEARPIPREARPFQGHRAGIVSRFLADAVDFAVVITVLVTVYVGWIATLFLLQPTSGITLPDVSVGAALLAYFVVATGYLAVGWWLTGRTFGKRLLGLRVVNFRGRPLRPVGALLRSLFCVFFPIGLFWVAFSRGNRSLADTVLRTSVIYDWRLRHLRELRRD